MTHAALSARTLLLAAATAFAASAATADTASDRQAGKVHFPISRPPAAHRKELRQPEEGGGDPGEAAWRAAGSSRRCALSDPQLRLAAARPAGAAGGAQLCADRSRRAACAAHALPHLYPARPLAGVDRCKPPRP